MKLRGLAVTPDPTAAHPLAQISGLLEVPISKLCKDELANAYFKRPLVRAWRSCGLMPTYLKTCESGRIVSVVAIVAVKPF